jgi:hypothetical protein
VTVLDTDVAVNCREEDTPAYTLRAHVEGNSEKTVELRFCSFECLENWT